MPVGDLEFEAMVKVLLVAPNSELIAAMQIEATGDNPFRLVVIEEGDAFAVGLAADKLRPDVIVVDFSIGDSAQQVCKAIRKNVCFAETILIAIVPGGKIAIDQSAINEVVKYPFNVRVLTARMHRLIGNRKTLAVSTYMLGKTLRTPAAAPAPPALIVHAQKAMPPRPTPVAAAVGDLADVLEWL